jgi:hypothetical protein
MLGHLLSADNEEAWNHFSLKAIDRISKVFCIGDGACLGSDPEPMPDRTPCKRFPDLIPMPPRCGKVRFFILGPRMTTLIGFDYLSRFRSIFAPVS